MPQTDPARAKRLAIVFEGLEAATAFGTARLSRPDGALRRIAGFSPADNPEIVVVVFLETGSGGGDAAPIANQIFAAYYAAR